MLPREVHDAVDALSAIVECTRKIVIYINALYQYICGWVLPTHKHQRVSQRNR